MNLVSLSGSQTHFNEAEHQIHQHAAFGELSEVFKKGGSRRKLFCHKVGYREPCSRELPARNVHF